jgi:catechol 2,3-dioxygenase-like lactoylglutathione lyase family enzyme
MGALSDARVEATVAVSDMGRAKAYYAETLGLTQVGGEADFFAVFECGGTRLNVYPSPYVGSAKSTVATFVVSDLDSAMAALRQNGVVFEDYDMTDGPTTVNGVADAGGIRSAWFKDPDGNTYSVSQVL